MMLFWIVSVALMLVALVILAPALLRARAAESPDRDGQNVIIAQERLAELNAEKQRGTLTEAQFDKSRSELEQSLLIDLDEAGQEASFTEASTVGRLTLGAMVLLVPVLTVGLYYHLGSPELMRPTQERMANADAPHQGDAMPSVEEMMAALMARLKENPEDSEGWFLLGRSYMALDNYAMASQTFEKLHQLVGDDPVVLLSWADAQAMAQSGNLAGKPSELIRKAVKLAPDDTTALWLAGMVENQTGNYELAISYWERLEPKIKDDPESRQRIESLLASAREKAGLETVGVSSPEPAVSTDAAENGGITVRVDLSPEFKGRVGPEESLFIYARALEGPRMPLAAARRKVRDLPLELTLDDSNAMVPAMKLSNFEQVLVGARISRTGEAIARSGDLSGEVSPVRVGATGVVEVLIDKPIP